jgi:SAM-dependent methyltransferase
MSVDFWNARYATDAYIFGTAPNAFLASQAGLIRPGMRALAIADGEGRNGVWLAERGAAVHAIDVSPLALDKARKLAAARGAALGLELAPEFELADVLNWDWPEAAYDLVVAIFIQFAPPPERDRIIAGIRRTLKPGGLLILQGYTPKQIEFGTGGPANPANLYTAALLREWFGDWDIRHLVEHEDFISEGTHHHGQSALIDLVAMKPGQD